MARMLELTNVSKAFGGLVVIDELDFHVDEHEIVSVIGPNGAGKTTLFNIVTGVYEPERARSSSKASRSSGFRRTRSRSVASRARSRTCGCS